MSIWATVNYGQEDFCFRGLETPVKGWFEGLEDGLIRTSAVCHPSQACLLAVKQMHVVSVEDGFLVGVVSVQLSVH